MKLGFVSAILPDQTLDEVLGFARDNRFETVEIMCWPVGKAERRYAGVTHIDVATLDAAGAAVIRAKFTAADVSLSGLGYYPNILTADAAEAIVSIEHLKKVITAAPLLGVNQVNTFIGRDPARSLADNWKVLDERLPALVRHAEQAGVRIGIENCPMYFSADEWPGGKNLATSPRNWRELFRRLPSPALGLNYDPSHLAWQMMDPITPLREFADRIFHVHAKDVQIDRANLDDVGIMATPLEFHHPVLPGRGIVDWPLFFQTLAAIGYAGPVCIEVEDRAYEGSLALRHTALRESAAFLRPMLNT
jgi:sugar phosphate isomerase/epimerase